MPTNLRDPFPTTSLPPTDGPARGLCAVAARPDRTALVAAGATALGMILLTATVTLLAILWLLVGRPVENLTGSLIDGLGAAVAAFGVIAVPAGAIVLAIHRAAAR